VVDIIKHPIIYRLSTIPLVVQDFAGPGEAKPPDPPDPALPHEPTAAPEILLFSIDPTAIASSTQVSTSKLCSSLFGFPISCPSNW